MFSSSPSSISRSTPALQLQIVLLDLSVPLTASHRIIVVLIVVVVVTVVFFIVLIGFHQSFVDLNAVGKNFRNDRGHRGIIVRIDTKQGAEAQGANTAIVNAGKGVTIGHPLIEEVADDRLSGGIIGHDCVQRLEESIGIQPENDHEHLNEHQTKFARHHFALKSLSDHLNDRRQSLKSTSANDLTSSLTTYNTHVLLALKNDHFDQFGGVGFGIFSQVIDDDLGTENCVREW